MDTKLKSNNIIIKIISRVILTVTIILLPLIISKTLDSYSPNKSIYESESVKHYLASFDNDVAFFTERYSDLDGTSRPKILEETIDSIKNSQKRSFYSKKEYIENNDVKDIYEDTMKSKEKLIEEARKDIIKSDEEVIEEAFNIIKNSYSYNKELIIDNNTNIEFYCENIEMDIRMSNVKNAKVEDFKNNTDDNFIIMKVGKNVGKNSQGMIDWEESIGLESWATARGFDRYYKMPKELQPGDFLYDIQEEEDSIKAKFNRNLIVIGVLGVVLLISLILTYKARGKYNYKIINKIYDYIPIEIKVISPVLIIINIFVIDWNLLKQPNESSFIFIPAQVILLVIYLLIIL